MTSCQCTDITTASKVKVAENGKKAIILNLKKEKISRTKVDGCLVVGKIASDWIVSKKDYGDVIIELKGCDVDHAVDQIVQTAKDWKSLKRSNGKLAALVVCSRVPKIDTQIQKGKEKFAKQNNGAPLHVVTQNNEYQFEHLFNPQGPLKG